MSDVVTLTLRGAVTEPVELDGVTADRCAVLSEEEIARLPILIGRCTAAVGDLFDVRGGRAPAVHIVGALDRVAGLAAGNAAGDVIIDGDAGNLVAAGMTGGRVEVRGSVGQDAGMSMAGGVLTVRGRAGDRLGSAAPGASKGMTGGEIVVAGSAGRDPAARLRRGLVVVGGQVGPDAGRAMIAGTLVVFGDVPAAPGRGNKRGSIVAVGSIAVPETYRYACTFDSTWVRLLMAYLRRRYQIAIDQRIAAGRYRRYCGDAGEPGKGEILQWVKEN